LLWRPQRQIAATTSTSYDVFGNVVSTQGPLGANQTSAYVYDADRELVGTISPNPGYGSLKYRAAKTTYSPDGLPTLIQTGTVTDQTPGMASFSALLQEQIGYDGIDRKLTDAVSSGGTTQSLSQYSYDNDNNLTCAAVRMNAAAFGSLPASACSLGTQGADGPDRITHNSYDNDNRVLQVTQGYGVSGDQSNVETLAYGANGETLSLTDGNNNTTSYHYDGLLRVSSIQYPGSSTEQ
jgi:YD repeat-containing protein